MQIIEVSQFAGVRSAVFTFRRPATALTFVVFPMVHLGERSFYAAVEARLRRCDLVVAEGVGPGSRRAQEITRSYRWAEGSSRLGLVVQDIDYRALGVPMVNPDMSGDEFDRGWRQRVPRWESALVRGLTPVVGLGIRMFASRRDLAAYLAMDDLRTPEEIEQWDLEAVRALLIDSRDRLVVDAIAAVHDRRSSEPIRVAVVYGAEHVRAIACGLHALGYRPGDGEWLTVFGWDEGVD